MGKNIFAKIIFGLLAILVFLNFLLVFVPETGFDALWYHLTLPKLLVTHHQWYFPGGLLYYSVMPRLAETIFALLIPLTSYVGPKFLQYFSGILTSYLIFKICRSKNIKPILSLSASAAYYFSFLVSWQSGSAYIDLIRTLLETTALYFALQNKKYLSGVFIGLAIGTKWQALGSLLLFAVIFGPQVIPFALLFAAPWFLIAYHFTGNPIYPIFDPIVSHTMTSPLVILWRIVSLPLGLLKPIDDFVSPLLPIAFLISLSGLRNIKTRKIALLSVLGILSVQFVSPPSARFVLPYFPALLIASALILQDSKVSNKYIASTVILTGVLIISMRISIYPKYIPFLLGKQSQNQYLLSQSSKLADTFIDSDNYFRDSLPKDAHYLIHNLHNLYYFPHYFDHVTWAKDLSFYQYFVTNTEPLGNIKLELLHTNSLGIKVYKILK